MNLSRIGCSTITLRTLPLGQALSRIAAQGIHRIDLGMIARFCPHLDPFTVDQASLSEVRQSLNQHGLAVSSCNTWSLVHLNDPEGLQKELPYLQASLRVAQRLGARVVSVQPGRTTSHDQWETQAKLVVRVLEQLGREANALGIRLGIEAPHKGTLTERFENALRMVQMTDPKLVGVVLDTSHVQAAGVPIEEALAQYATRVCHVHLRDFKDGGPATPGDGDVDFAGVFAGLEQIGYSGDFNLELEYRDLSPEQIESELSRALEHVHKEVT